MFLSMIISSSVINANVLIYFIKCLSFQSTSVSYNGESISCLLSLVYGTDLKNHIKHI